MDKFKNKYRIESHRMPGWDYSGNGMYFITLVVQNRECHLEKMENNEIILSDWGKIVNDEWLKSFEIRNELFCDEYVIMPNHLHAIIIIDKSINNPSLFGGAHGADGSHGLHGLHGTHVETHGRASLQPSPSPSPTPSQQPPPPSSSDNSVFVRKPQSISSFVGGFKSAINSKIDDYIDEHHLKMPKYNRNNHFFQPNYHDRIIRDGGEYQRTKQYIINNPKN